VKKHLITLCIASGLAVAGTSVATASPTPDGNLTISNEAAGPNCTYGGLRIDVQHGKKDGIQQMNYKPAPPPDPKDGVFYVCNGAPGTNGAPGPAGPAGEVGSVGAPGPAGAAGQNTSRSCVTSVRDGARMYLPSGLRNQKRVQLQIQGPNTTKLRYDKSVVVGTTTSNRPFVFVPLLNRGCGSYIVTVRAENASKPIAELWKITGLFGLHRQPIK
jgi:hypothetical protein